MNCGLHTFGKAQGDIGSLISNSHVFHGQGGVLLYAKADEGHVGLNLALF